MIISVPEALVRAVARQGPGVLSPSWKALEFSLIHLKKRN